MKVIRSLIKATTALSLLAISITSAYADVIRGPNHTAPLHGESRVWFRRLSRASSPA